MHIIKTITESIQSQRQSDIIAQCERILQVSRPYTAAHQLLAFNYKHNLFRPFPSLTRAQCERIRQVSRPYTAAHQLLAFNYKHNLFRPFPGLPTRPPSSILNILTP
ncbi:hypothetical protein J6590_013579 [Homalodisca vitripennis]|nr:hypothetical protein J6590_013579 [Homalodisca vitripennis]